MHKVWTTGQIFFIWMFNCSTTINLPLHLCGEIKQKNIKQFFLLSFPISKFLNVFPCFFLLKEILQHFFENMSATENFSYFPSFENMSTTEEFSKGYFGYIQNLGLVIFLLASIISDKKVIIIWTVPLNVMHCFFLWLLLRYFFPLS